VLPHIRSGKLVPIAVMTPERVSFAKDVPTVSESPGMKGYQVSHWMGVFMPPRTPPELVERMQTEFTAVLAAPEVRERLQGMGIDPVANTPAEFRDFLAADRDRFAKMFRLTGLSTE